MLVETEYAETILSRRDNTFLSRFISQNQYFTPKKHSQIFRTNKQPYSLKFRNFKYNHLITVFHGVLPFYFCIKSSFFLFLK